MRHGLVQKVSSFASNYKDDETVTHLYIDKRTPGAKVQLQWRNELTLLKQQLNTIPQFYTRGGTENELTTARLVNTERMSQPRVIGGIWNIQASIPTGIASGRRSKEPSRVNGHVPDASFVYLGLISRPKPLSDGTF